MCISPVSIPNPNFGNRSALIQRIADTKSSRINVPCCVCSECVQSRQQQIVQRCRTMSLDHYAFFITLTYNPKSLPYYALSNGYSIPYADIKDLQNAFKRIRKAGAISRPFSYLAVTERGSSKGRPHFHVLLFVQKQSSDTSFTPRILESQLWHLFFKEWRRNYGSTRNPDYRPLFDYHRKIVAGKEYKNYDLHYVDPSRTDGGHADVAFYVTKYMLKPSRKEDRLRQALALNLPDDDYEVAWQTIRSKMLISKHFGYSTTLERDYILMQIKNSVMNPKGFQYTTEQGSFQLARYYRKFIPAHDFVMNMDISGGPLAVFKRREKTVEDISRSLNQHERIKDILEFRDISVYLPT